MSDRRDDGRDEALSRAYRAGAGEEPPPALDALILAAARREVEAKPIRARAGWLRWAAPVGVFATVVLTVSLTLLVQREQPDLLPQSAPPVAPAPAPVAQAQRSEPVPAAAKPIARPESKVRVNEARPTPPPAETAPAPKEEAGFVPAPAPAAAPGDDARRGRSEAAPEMAPRPMEGASRPAPATALQGAMRQAAPAAKAAGAVGALRDEDRAAPAPAPGQAAAEAYAPRKASRTAEATRTPEQWLDDIRRLRREGRMAEAQDQLAAFRRAYPDYRLPDDLKTP